MEIYTLLRAFADSWMLLLMTAIFIGAVVYAFRPGSRVAQNEAAQSIFRHENRPAFVDISHGPQPEEALK